MTDKINIAIKGDVQTSRDNYS